MKTIVKMIVVVTSLSSLAMAGEVDRRAANGGDLTAAERRQVNREENRESRRIYAAKHNARHQ